MNRFTLFIALLAVCAFVAPLQSRAQDAGIAVVVNEGAISVSDVNDRLRLIMVSSGFPDKEEIKQKLMPQIIGSLIEEELKFQEAQEEELEIAPEEVEAGFAQLAKQNNLTVEQFKGALAQSGVNVATMERQIKSQLLWRQVIQKKLRPRITISNSDVDAFIARIEATKGKPEYFAAEIFLPVESPEQEGDIKGLAQNLALQVRTKKASFFKLAQQFSRAPGAPQGGDLGWVQGDQLAEELSAALDAMEKGSVSDPIRTTRGYHLLFLRDSRIISDESIPERGVVEKIIGTQRLERAQARLLLDLKSAAFIENRV